jgi:hypothetical protein
MWKTGCGMASVERASGVHILLHGQEMPIEESIGAEK